MKLGCCINIESVLNGEARALLDKGCSYVELPLANIAELGEDDYNRLKGIAEKDDIKIYACNIFLPGKLRVTGDTADIEAFSAYLDKALPRAVELGVEIIVFGSGRSRKVEDGFPFDRAWRQLVELLVIASEKAAKFDGLTIVVEPLNKGECNIINTVAEGYRLAKEVDRDNIKLLADYFHMAKEDEPIESIVKHGDILRHIHFADPDGRIFPRMMKDEFILFFKVLKEIGYTGGVSLEGTAENLADDTKTAYNVLKEFFK